MDLRPPLIGLHHESFGKSAKEGPEAHNGGPQGGGRAPLAFSLAKIVSVHRNAAISAAGSIRQMHSVFTWVMVLQKLQTDGRAPSDVIAAWNRQATHASQLQGLKRVSCL